MWMKGRWVAYPFQNNISALPQEDQVGSVHRSVTGPNKLAGYAALTCGLVKKVLQAEHAGSGLGPSDKGGLSRAASMPALQCGTGHCLDFIVLALLRAWRQFTAGCRAVLSGPLGSLPPPSRVLSLPRLTGCLLSCRSSA